ncbi:MAG: hypothetical protein PHT33_10785 [bacterium]|nr:hypothetical protein [bacterium]
MRERPILFNGELVKLIPDGRKTKTRRKLSPNIFGDTCRYGETGDRLGVIENSRMVRAVKRFPWLWERLWRLFVVAWVEIVFTHIEELWDITPEDCIAEGLESYLREHDAVQDLRSQYQELWDSIYGYRSWNVNPWVWVIEFKLCEASK